MKITVTLTFCASKERKSSLMKPLSTYSFGSISPTICMHPFGAVNQKNLNVVAPGRPKLAATKPRFISQVHHRPSRLFRRRKKRRAKSTKWTKSLLNSCISAFPLRRAPVLPNFPPGIGFFVCFYPGKFSICMYGLSNTVSFGSWIMRLVFNHLIWGGKYNSFTSCCV